MIYKEGCRRGLWDLHYRKPPPPLFVFGRRKVAFQDWSSCNCMIRFKFPLVFVSICICVCVFVSVFGRVVRPIGGRLHFNIGCNRMIGFKFSLVFVFICICVCVFVSVFGRVVMRKVAFQDW